MQVFSGHELLVKVENTIYNQKMQEKSSFSKKVLKALTEKPITPVKELTNKINPSLDSKGPLYALTRSLKGLEQAGMVERLSSEQKEYLRLTKLGRVRASSQKLDASDSLLNPNWDGKWRIILLDLPESRKSERESLRYLLKKAGFVCLKNSAWISPYPYEHLFTNIKNDLGLTTEMIILTTSTLDQSTEIEFLKNFRQTNF